MAQSRQPTLSPSNTQPDSKIECSSIGHITNTSRNLSRSFSNWRRAAANPNSADNPKSALTNHIRGAYISHHQSKWRRAAATPHSARQPQSAFINKTQRQHLPPPISMAARNRPTTYLITVVKAVRAPQHLPSDNPNCELIVRQGATTSRFQFLWLRIAVYPHPARPTKATCS